jgi:hypothetical protein
MACKTCKEVVVQSCDTCYCSNTVCTPCKIKLPDRCITVTSALPNIGDGLECKDLNTVLLALNSKAGHIASNQFAATSPTTDAFPITSSDEYRWAGKVFTGVNLWSNAVYTEGLDSAPTAFSNASDQRMAGIPVPFDIAAGAKLVLTGTFTNTNNVQINGKVAVGFTACASPATAITQLVEASGTPNYDITTAQIGTMYTTCFRKEFTVPAGGITKGTNLLVVGWQVSQTLTSSDNIIVSWTLSS